MDVLSDVLANLRLRSSLYFSTEFSTPWGLRVPEFRRVARFHLVVRGDVWAVIEGIDPIHLEGGDIILVPHGTNHKLADTAERPCLSVDDVVQRAGFTGDGPLVFGGEDTGLPTRMVCGHFDFADGAEHPLIASLPTALVLRSEEYLEHAALIELYRFIVREVKRGGPGMQAVVQRLSEVMFIETVRYWADSSRHEPGFFRALQDPNIADSLEAIHTNPSKDWNLSNLARHARLGRSAFAERFTRLVGIPPGRYVAMWRVEKAKDALRTSTDPVESIAESVGYDSGAAFTRAFKKIAGTTPGRFRRHHTTLAG